MTTRVVAMAVAAATALTLVPLTPALAQVEHAQRLALDVAIRRAQVRVLLCEQQRPPTTQQTVAGDLAKLLPPSPAAGTAGPVDCARRLWPVGG